MQWRWWRNAGRDRVVDTLDLERRSQTGEYVAAHGARTSIKADLLHAFFTQNVRSFIWFSVEAPPATAINANTDG